MLYVKAIYYYKINGYQEPNVKFFGKLADENADFISRDEKK